jgi:hypothetical protein
MGLISFVKKVFGIKSVAERAKEAAELEEMKKQMAMLLAEKKKREELEEESKNTQIVFDKIKANSSQVTADDIDLFEQQTDGVISTMLSAGQIVGATKAKWLKDVVIPREKELVSLGVTKAVYRADIATFISKHKTRAIKLVTLLDYTRVIPPHAIEMINKTKHIFHQFVIVYTDHSIQAAMEVKKRTDPILFGVFNETVPVLKLQEQCTSGIVNTASLSSAQNKITVMSDRLYFLADWEDEQCDLTFDQMVREFPKVTGKQLTVMPPDAVQPVKSRIDNAAS